MRLKVWTFLRHSKPHQVPSRVKFNLFQSCVVSIILYCNSSWSSNFSLTRKMESLNHKGLKTCFGNNSYSSLFHALATMLIAYQKIERDLRLFAGISSGATCINFHDHFTVQCDNRSLRSNVKPKLVAPTGQGHFVTSHLGDNMASVTWATKVSTKWVDQIGQLTDILKEVSIFVVWLGRFAPFAK